MVTIDIPIMDSSPFLMVHPVTSTLRLSTTQEAYVPYSEIDDIPFIDDEDYNHNSIEDLIF